MKLLFDVLIFRYPDLLQHICVHHFPLHEVNHELRQFVILGPVIDMIISLLQIVHISDHTKELIRCGDHLVCRVFNSIPRCDITKHFWSDNLFCFLLILRSLGFTIFLSHILAITLHIFDLCGLYIVLIN